MPSSTWRCNLHAWMQAAKAHRNTIGNTELDASDIDSDAEYVYAFAHTEADTFPRGWDDVRDDFEDDDLYSYAYAC